MQNYVLKFVDDLREGLSFSLGTPVSSANKTDRHNITEILLKVALKKTDNLNIIEAFLCLLQPLGNKHIHIWKRGRDFLFWHIFFRLWRDIVEAPEFIFGQTGDQIFFLKHIQLSIQIK